jgi:uncharacterized membrane protein YeiH
VNEVPSVLHEDVYGTIAVLVGLATGVLHAYGIDHRPLAPFVFVGGLGLRFAVLATGSRLPRIR